MLFQRIYKYLKDLLDVSVTTPTDGQVLKYQASSSKWINSTQAASLPLTGGEVTGNVLIDGTLGVGSVGTPGTITLQTNLVSGSIGVARLNTVPINTQSIASLLLYNNHAVATWNNVLDDGSGNQTVIGSISFPNQTTGPNWPTTLDYTGLTFQSQFGNAGVSSDYFGTLYLNGGVQINQGSVSLSLQDTSLGNAANFYSDGAGYTISCDGDLTLRSANMILIGNSILRFGTDEGGGPEVLTGNGNDITIQDRYGSYLSINGAAGGVQTYGGNTLDDGSGSMIVLGGLSVNGSALSVDSSGGDVSTAYNTLDDGSGNVTVAGTLAALSNHIQLGYDVNTNTSVFMKCGPGGQCTVGLNNTDGSQGFSFGYYQGGNQFYLSNGVDTVYWTYIKGSGTTFTGSVSAGSFSGSGASLTSLNGTNISSGTVANARTTATSANTASAIVARDGSGNFTAGTITANLSSVISAPTVLNFGTLLSNATIVTIAYGEYHMTLGASITLTLPSGSVDGQELRFRFQQDGTGSRTLTWGGSIAFGTTIPNTTLTTTANKVDLITLRWDATKSSWLVVAFNKGY